MFLRSLQLNMVVVSVVDYINSHSWSNNNLSSLPKPLNEFRSHIDSPFYIWEAQLSAYRKAKLSLRARVDKIWWRQCTICSPNGRFRWSAISGTVPRFHFISSDDPTSWAVMQRNWDVPQEPSFATLIPFSRYIYFTFLQKNTTNQCRLSEISYQSSEETALISVEMLEVSQPDAYVTRNLSNQKYVAWL